MPSDRPRTLPPAALGFDDALRIARGCTDYGGGHRGDASAFEVYQHGIQTVINALTAARERGLTDTQVAALHRMGTPATAPGSREPGAGGDAYREALVASAIENGPDLFPAPAPPTTPAPETEEDWSHRCPECGASVCSHVVLMARGAHPPGVACAWHEGYEEGQRLEREAILRWLRQNGAVIQAGRLAANLLALAPVAPEGRLPPAPDENDAAATKRYVEAVDDACGAFRPTSPCWDGNVAYWQGRLSAQRERLDACFACREKVASAAPETPAPAGEPQPIRVPVEVTRRTDDDGTVSFDAPGFTTVRACRRCGVLIAGGPTACLVCAAAPAKEEP
jgi:hypothetical protein